MQIQALIDLENISGPNRTGRKLRHESIMSDIGDLLEKKQLCDVTLVVGESEETRKEIQAHKVILGARSPVFAAMFKHQMKEQTQGRVTITDVKAEVFEELLSFIYTGKIRSLEVNPDELLMASDKV